MTTLNGRTCKIRFKCYDGNDGAASTFRFSTRAGNLCSKAVKNDMEDALRGQIAKLGEILGKSRRTVFFGGAGTSTESGIPDFRSGDGVFQAIKQFGYEPEVLISHDFFLRHTETFYE